MANPARYETCFDAVHADERKRLQLPNPVSELGGVGIAMSGGGIRSASFAPGLVQHFLNPGFLQRVDCLPTVSGGGYLGSAVGGGCNRRDGPGPETCVSG